MPEIKEEFKNRIIFRNPMNRVWYLQRRPDQAASEANYILGPNQTVEALNEAEEMLLASVGLVDVRKESPAIANSIDSLRKQLEEAKSKNAELVAQNELLKAPKSEKVETASSKKR